MTAILLIRIRPIQYIPLLLALFCSFAANAQTEKWKRKEQLRYEEKMKSGHDSLYIEFIYRSNIADSNTFYAASGWYKSPLAARENPVLVDHMLIVPAQQNLERALCITAFTHEMKRPDDFTYPRFFRNDPLELPAFEPQSAEQSAEIVSGVMDGVFLRRDTILREFEKEKKHLLDSVVKAQEAYRKEKMQPWITELLQPFYFSQMEVTNNEYRQFVNWVRDSIAMRMLYFGLEDDQEAVKWLSLTEKEAAKFDFSKRTENLQKYGLNYSLKIDYEDENLVPLLTDMYYPQPPRFYKRREYDSRKFIYVRTNGDTLAVYPDTLSFVREGGEFHDPLTNMYFWHAAYDNYPIVGLSYEQATAYCEWYQRQVNETLKNQGYRAEIRIPSLFEYEMAVKYNLSRSGKHQVENLPNDAFHLFVRPKYWREYVFLRPVKSTFIDIECTSHEAKDCQPAWRYNNWLQANISTPIYFLNGNASEFCSTSITPEMVAYYKLDVPVGTDLSKNVLLIGSNFREDVIDLQGNQKNAVFYKRVVPKSKTGAKHGFRTVIYLEKIK